MHDTDYRQLVAAKGEKIKLIRQVQIAATFLRVDAIMTTDAGKVLETVTELGGILSEVGQYEPKGAKSLVRGLIKLHGQWAEVTKGINAKAWKPEGKAKAMWAQMEAKGLGVAAIIEAGQVKRAMPTATPEAEEAKPKVTAEAPEDEPAPEDGDAHEPGTPTYTVDAVLALLRTHAGLDQIMREALSLFDAEVAAKVIELSGNTGTEG